MYFRVDRITSVIEHRTKFELPHGVEFAEGADEKKTMKAVRKACKKVEPDCEIEL